MESPTVDQVTLRAGVFWSRGANSNANVSEEKSFYTSVNTSNTKVYIFQLHDLSNYITLGLLFKILNKFIHIILQHSKQSKKIQLADE